MPIGSSTARPLGLVLAAAFGWAGPGAPAGAAAVAVKPGVFLYASPALGDPNFIEAVVLVLHHGAEGSVGLIVNHPTRIPLSEAVTELAELRTPDLRLHRGGPVAPDSMVALVRSNRPLAGARRVLPDAYLSTEPAQWKAAALEPNAKSRLRVYAGYAGWAPGQLGSELAQGSWVVGPADAGSVFSPHPSEIWPRVHQLMRRMEVYRSAQLPGM